MHSLLRGTREQLDSTCDDGLARAEPTHRGRLEATGIESGTDPVARKTQVVEARLAGVQPMLTRPANGEHVMVGAVDVGAHVLAIEALTARLAIRVDDAVPAEVRPQAAYATVDPGQEVLLHLVACALVGGFAFDDRVAEVGERL